MSTVLGWRKKRRKLGWWFPAEGAEAASTKTLSSSDPVSVAIGSFAQTLSPALAETLRTRLVDVSGDKTHTRTAFLCPYAYFAYAYTCLLLTSTF